MTIDILICTIDEGVGGVEAVLMPPAAGVRYVVSVQHTRPLASMPPEWHAVMERLRSRTDLSVVTLEGRGLSRNRNNALRHATADVLVVADDDCRYTPEQLEYVRKAYAAHPSAGVICFEAESYDHQPMKVYPRQTLPYAEACRRGYYPTSMELTFSRVRLAAARVAFDERFGLGAPHYIAGEEEVLLADAERAGLEVVFVPEVITATDPQTTGDRFLTDRRLQETKGAVFRHRFGLPQTLWRTLKEGAHHLVYHGVNPLPIWRNMLRGCLQTQRRAAAEANLLNPWT